jgi:hypothetical protein
MADWYSNRCALTWKVKGTKFSRLLFQLQVKTHHIEGTDAGLWLSTPRAQEVPRSEKFAKGRTMSPSEYVKVMLLKTPCSADAYTENLSKKEQKFGNSGTLAQEVQTGFIYQRGMLPTPDAASGKTGYMGKNRKGKQQNLETVIRNSDDSLNSQLNPRFVAEMMGFPPNWTELPFLNGEQNPSKDMETP